MQPTDPQVAIDENGQPRSIAGNFQCQMQLSQQRNIVVTGYIYSDDNAEKINERLDAYQDALDRQFVRCDIVNKEAQLTAQVAQLEGIRNALEELAAKGASDGLSSEKPKHRLTSTQKQQLQNGEQTMKHHLANIDLLRAAIKEGRAKLGQPGA